MNKQELRDKIIGIVLDVPITGIKIRDILGGVATANNIAEALITAGIGDVSEYKHRAEVAERALRKIVEADRAGCLDEKKAVEGMFYFYLQQAEKELQEERKDD